MNSDPEKRRFFPADGEWDKGHPYAWRTWLRGNLPWVLINLGVATKGVDCEAVGAWHRWYNVDGEHSGCYHCEVIRPDKLWNEPAV